ncbi:ISKra4 family transposase, partial [Streptomyces coacervatus]|nr:ISKra4 family transposase [Streptomyces coacervatus]
MPGSESPMNGAYAATTTADPFDHVLSFLTSLVARLSDPGALDAPHEKTEAEVECGMRELGRLLLQGQLDLRARREEERLAALDAGGRAALAGGRTRLEKGHHRMLATVMGLVTVTRCALRAPGLSNCYPADAVLGLPHERHSLGLRRLAVLEA